MAKKSASSNLLHCRSCGRAAISGPNGAESVVFLGQRWCARCAKVGHIPGGAVYVSQPSPGRMYEGATKDVLDIWSDCFEMVPKRRIKIREAKSEVQRAWKNWNGKKSSVMSMLIFFGWLQRFRPYFLTFRTRGDPWQDVHSWLIECERMTGKNRVF
jgi:hypothetical protein